MKIAIIGAGAMGTIIAGYLKLIDIEVYLYGHRNNQHVNAINNDGLVIKTKDYDMKQIDIPVSLSYNNMPIVDCVIVLVKGTNTLQVSKEISSIIDQQTVICTLQNGLGNTGILKENFPNNRILYGCLNMSSRIIKPGEVHGELFGETNIEMGCLTNDILSSESGLELSKIFNNAGLTSIFDKNNVDIHIWNKVMLNTVTNATLALVRLPVGIALQDPTVVDFSKQIIKEVIAVASATGISGLSESHFWNVTIPRVVSKAKNHVPSMAQDVIFHKSKTEIDNLNGAITRLGAAAKVNTPYNEVITKLIKIIEENYQFQIA